MGWIHLLSMATKYLISEWKLFMKNTCFYRHGYLFEGNCSLSYKRVMDFTQLYSNPSITLIAEFVSKERGMHTELHPLQGIKFNYAPKGSYRFEQMLHTISNLPNRYNILSPKNYAIYALDEYSVHLIPETKEALLKRGCLHVIIVGGVTGDKSMILTYIVHWK